MNFDKEKFSEILVMIKDSYGSINKMAEKMNVTAAYLSKLINLKYDNSPSPEILKKIAENSNNLINYEDLMTICGYFDYPNISLLLKKAGYNPSEYSEKDKKHFASVLSSFRNLLVHNDFSRNEFSLEKFLDNFASPEYDNAKTEELLYIYVVDLLSNFLAVNDTKLILDYFNKRFNPSEEYYKKFEATLYTAKNSNSQFYMCPVYGQISAGQPNWANECIEGRIPIDPVLFNIADPEEHFFLRINGESMNKVVRNNAYALIHKQDVVENGEIAVVLVNGYDATLKKFTKNNNVVVLEPMSDDDSFQTQIYDDKTEIKILGKYIGKFELNK